MGMTKKQAERIVLEGLAQEQNPSRSKGSLEKAKRTLEKLAKLEEKAKSKK